MPGPDLRRHWPIPADGARLAVGGPRHAAAVDPRRRPRDEGRVDAGRSRGSRCADPRRRGARPRAACCRQPPPSWRGRHDGDGQRRRSGRLGRSCCERRSPGRSGCFVTFGRSARNRRSTTFAGERRSRTSTSRRCRRGLLDVPAERELELAAKLGARAGVSRRWRVAGRARRPRAGRRRMSRAVGPRHLVARRGM